MEKHVIHGGGDNNFIDWCNLEVQERTASSKIACMSQKKGVWVELWRVKQAKKKSPSPKSFNLDIGLSPPTSFALHLWAVRFRILPSRGRSENLIFVLLSIPYANRAWSKSVTTNHCWFCFRTDILHRMYHVSCRLTSCLLHTCTHSYRP